MKRTVMPAAGILAAVLVLVFAGTAASPAPRHVSERRAQTSFNLSTASCNEFSYLSHPLDGSKLTGWWGHDSCHWFGRPAAYCANPRLGTVEGWKHGGWVTSLNFDTTAFCTSPNVVIHAHWDYKYTSSGAIHYVTWF